MNLLSNRESTIFSSKLLSHKCGILTATGNRFLTNAHHDKEARQESAKINNSAIPAFHEVVRIARTATYPIGQRRYNVRACDKEGVVAVEEGGGQDYEEKAYCEDLDG